MDGRLPLATSKSSPNRPIIFKEFTVMITDIGTRVAQHASPDLKHLPDVLDVHTRIRRFDPARRVTTHGVHRQVRSAVEIEVRLSEPFAIRTLGPVLWIGEEPLSIAESDGGNTYRFFSLEPEHLQAGAPIALSWGERGSPRKMTKFHYRPPVP
jgi:hypothetical protein